MKRHMIATKMNRETVILTKTCMFRSVDQFDDIPTSEKDIQL